MSGDYEAINNFLECHNICREMGLTLDAKDGVFLILKDNKNIYSKVGLGSIRSFLDGYHYLYSNDGN